MKIALIGAGGITRAHLPGLVSLGEVRVFSVEGAAELAAEWNLEVLPSYEEALAWADAVDICTPTHTHFDLARRALEAGVDVICEKPLCRTSADAQALVDLAAERGRVLLPAHVVRFFPAYVALHDAVQAGGIGELAVLRFMRSGTYPAWSTWFGNEEHSGGLVMDLMIHDLDQARWLAGPVTSVFATQVEMRAGGSDGDGNGDGTSDSDIASACDNDSAAPGASRIAGCHCILTHASGAISYIRGVWGAQSTVFETSFHVAGDGGYLEYESRDDYLVRTNGLDLSMRSIVPASNADDPYGNELREFVAHIEGRATARVSALDGVMAVRLAEAALESIRTGRAVAFDEGDAGASACGEGAVCGCAKEELK